MKFHDMKGIGAPQAECSSRMPNGEPTPMTVRFEDVSAKAEAPYTPHGHGDRQWFVLWLRSGAVLWFSPDEGA